MSLLSAQNLSLLLVLEVSFLNHGNDCIVNGSLVVESPQHLLLEFQVWDFGADGHSSLNCFFNLLARVRKLLWCLIIFGVRHATGCRVQSRDLEEPMRFLYVLNLNYWIEVHLCNSFRDTDDCLQLTYCDWNAIGLLGNSLRSRLRPVCYVQVLKHMASFFCQLWLTFVLGVAYVLSKHLQRYLALLLFLIMLHVQSKHVACNCFVDSILPNITYNENWVKSRKNRCLEVNLLRCVLKVIISAEKWVGCCEDRASGVENGSNACLGYRDGLLLHSLVNGHSVLRSHLVKLIDADDTTVS